MELGDRIGSWLRIRAMTQKALAKAVGVSPAAVNAWVKGESSPTQKNLLSVVAALGLTMAEFYGALPKDRRTRLSA